MATLSAVQQTGFGLVGRRLSKPLPRELFVRLNRIWLQDAAMKALLTSRPEIRWAAAAIPAIFLAHWIVTAVCLHLSRLLPESVRTILQLL